MTHSFDDNRTKAVYPVTVPGEQYGMYGASLPTMLFKNRVLHFHTDFNQQAIQHFMMSLDFLASTEAMKEEGRPKKITIHVSSPGGLVDDGCFLMDRIELIKELTGEPVEIIVETRAASMGSLMSQSASPGRLMMHYGNISESVNMVHALSYGHPADKRDAHGRQYGEALIKMANLYRYYLRRIHRTLVEFHGYEAGDELMSRIFRWLVVHMEARDTYLDPIEAYEAGMVDFIILHERSRVEYDKAMQWREGFFKEVSSPGVTGTAETRLEPQKKRVSLSEDEYNRATQRVIQLQREAYEQAKKLREHKHNNAVVQALRAMDKLREKEGSGPIHGIHDEKNSPMDTVIEVFKASLRPEDTTIDPTPDQRFADADETDNDDK